MNNISHNIFFASLVALISASTAVTVAGQNKSLKHHSSTEIANIVYVEVTVVKRPSSISQPCNIVLFDINRKLGEPITNDSLVNDLPVISPDGKRVLFVSNRATDYQKRLVLGDMAPKQIYLYDTESKAISLFPERDIGVWEKVAWSNNVDALITITDGKLLYSHSFDKGRNQQILEIKEDGYIGSMSLSPSGRSIAFDFTLYSPIQFSLRVLDIDRQKVSVLQTYKRSVSVCDWSPDEKKLLVCDSLLKRFDLSSGESQCLNIPMNIHVVEAKYISDNEIILLANHELFLYNDGDHSLVQLTHDGQMKRDLTVRSSFRN
jgi:Tol biopolymer transport system component